MIFSLKAFVLILSIAMFSCNRSEDGDSGVESFAGPNGSASEEKGPLHGEISVDGSKGQFTLTVEKDSSGKITGAVWNLKVIDPGSLQMKDDIDLKLEKVALRCICGPKFKNSDIEIDLDMSGESVDTINYFGYSASVTNTASSSTADQSSASQSSASQSSGETEEKSATYNGKITIDGGIGNYTLTVERDENGRLTGGTWNMAVVEAGAAGMYPDENISLQKLAYRCLCVYIGNSDISIKFDPNSSYIQEITYWGEKAVLD